MADADHPSTIVAILDRLAREPRPDQFLYKADGAWRSLGTHAALERIDAIAAFLIDFGIEPGDRVAIFSENRPDWTITDFAILSARAISVPLFPTLSPEQLAVLLAHSGARVAIVSGGPLHGKLRQAAAKLSDPPRVLILDARAEEPGCSFEEATLDEAIAHGARALASNPRLVADRRKAVAPGDVASIIYTSGTTGEPKGVTLTHANFRSNVDACTSLIPLRREDLALSILPLSHVFERSVEWMYLSCGASIAHIESLEALSRALVEVRPTVLAAVPRLLEKLHVRITSGAEAEGGVKAALFRWALGVSRRRLACTLGGTAPPLGLRLAHAIAERAVLRAVRERLGGRLRFVISGGAPLGREIAEFFMAIGIPILEGYGMTETSPVISVNLLTDPRPGTVGPPLPNLEVKIAGDGEILVRGPSVMAGYWRDEEATRAIIKDGFLATGDIGALDASGLLRVTDRKKELLITSGGKNISPQAIEEALRASPFVTSAVLIGDRRPFLAALVVPDFAALGRYASEQGIEDREPGRLVEHPDVRSLIEAEIARLTETFASHERVRRFRLLNREFSQAEGELTPTLKIRRRVVMMRYAGEIEEMYRS